MSPDDQLLEALPNFNAAFPFTSLSSSWRGTGLWKCSESTASGGGGPGPTVGTSLLPERTDDWVLLLRASSESHLHRALPSLFSPHHTE